VFGFDLGTESPRLGLEASEQGKGRFSINYDAILRNRSDSYQTPLVGAGTNRLTLPSTWIVPVVPRVSTSGANARGLLPDVTSSSALVSGVLTAPTAAQLAQAAALQAADLPAFQHVDLSTRRSKIDFNALLNLGTRWDMTADVKHEDCNGLKPMGTVTRFTNGDISTIIPDLIDQTHDQISVGLNYTGDKLVVQGTYFVSTLTNNVSGMTWANWAAATNLQTMSSAPSNEVHQAAVTANYRFTNTTRLSTNFTYGRSTQDVPFLTDASTPLVPVSSLHGLVINKAASLKLTSRPMAGLNLSAAYKYDLRDNQTPVNIFGYYDAGELKSGTSVFSSAYPTLGLGSNTNINANRPYSRKLNQANLDADYALTSNQTLRGGLESQKIDRWCNGTWIACVDANSAKENTLHLDYNANATETLSGRVGLAHSSRTVDYNENAFLALVPMANVSPTGAPAGSSAYSTLVALGLTGYGPVLGLNALPAAGSAAAFFFANNNALANSLYANQNRISELVGMRRYNMADRVRDKVRSSLNWQASDALSLQASLDVNRDNYDKSVYGLQNAKGWAATLDGSLAADRDTSLSAFVTLEDQRSRSSGNSYTANSTAANVNGFTAISGGCFATIALRNASNKIDPCLDWFSDAQDKVTTLGLAATRKNLLEGKLDLNGGLSFSSVRSSNNVIGGNYVNNPLAVAGAPAGTVAAFFVPATPLPDAKTRMLELRFGGKYRIDDSHTVRLGYMFQRLTSNDWIYDGMQPGGLAGVLPWFEQSPSYKVHTFSLSFIYAFR
jgi:hypothetical protein